MEKKAISNVVSMIHWAEIYKYKLNAKKRAHVDAMWLHSIEVQTNELPPITEEPQQDNTLPDIVPWV